MPHVDVLRSRWLDTFTDLATQEDPVGQRTRRGRGEIGEFWDRVMSGYESLEILPRDIFVTGREAAMEWTINAATPEGTITFDGVDVFIFDEAARIVSVRAYWERARIDDQRRHLQGTNRYRGLYGAGQAAARSGNRDKARHYFSKLIELAGSGDLRPEMERARRYLASQ